MIFHNIESIFYLFLNHISTLANWAVTCDLEPISAKPPRPVMCDGRTERNGTVVYNSEVCLLV